VCAKSPIAQRALPANHGRTTRQAVVAVVVNLGGGSSTSTITKGELPSLQAAREVVSASSDLTIVQPRDANLWESNYQRFDAWRPSTAKSGCELAMTAGSTALKNGPNSRHQGGEG